MVNFRSGRQVKKGRPRRATRAEPKVDRKLRMTCVWLTPQHVSLLDEICYYIGRNSMGTFRPNRSELIRLLIERLQPAKRKLKQVRRPEELKKAIFR